MQRFGNGLFELLLRRSLLQSSIRYCRRIPGTSTTEFGKDHLNTVESSKLETSVLHSEPESKSRFLLIDESIIDGQLLSKIEIPPVDLATTASDSQLKVSKTDLKNWLKEECERYSKTGKKKDKQDQLTHDLFKMLLTAVNFEQIHVSESLLLWFLAAFAKNNDPERVAETAVQLRRLFPMQTEVNRRFKPKDRALIMEIFKAALNFKNSNFVTVSQLCDRLTELGFLTNRETFLEVATSFELKKGNFDKIFETWSSHCISEHTTSGGQLFFHYALTDKKVSESVRHKRILRILEVYEKVRDPADGIAQLIVAMVLTNQIEDARILWTRLSIDCKHFIRPIRNMTKEENLVDVNLIHIRQIAELISDCVLQVMKKPTKRSAETVSENLDQNDLEEAPEKEKLPVKDRGNVGFLLKRWRVFHRRRFVKAKRRKYTVDADQLEKLLITLQDVWIDLAEASRKTSELDDLEQFLNENELVLTEKNKKKFSEIKISGKSSLPIKKIEEKKVPDVKVSKSSTKKVEKHAPEVKSDKLPVEKSEEKKILSMIYDGNATEVVENWNSNSSGLPEEKIPTFGLRLSSHLLAAGMVDDGFKLLRSVENAQFSDDQFLAALERIIRSNKLQNRWEIVEKFYQEVVLNGFHRKRNRDFLLSKLLQAAISSDPRPSFDKLFDLYIRLSNIEPELTEKEQEHRKKIHPICFWTIIKLINENTPEDKPKLEKLFEYIKLNGSTLQSDCFRGIWLLFQGKPLEFTDLLYVGGSSFSGNHIEFLIIVAEANKESKILENLLDYPEFFNKLDLLVKTCETIALICGKNKDFDGLKRLYGRIMRLYKSSPEERHITKFRKVLYRISHFYKCNNSAVPENLAQSLKMLG